MLEINAEQLEAQPVVSVLRRRDVPLADDIRALMDAVPFPDAEKTVLLPVWMYEHTPKVSRRQVFGVTGLIFWGMSNTAICIYNRPAGDPFEALHIAVLDLGPCEG